MRYFRLIFTVVTISLVILIMNRFDWYAREVGSQILEIQLPNNVDFDTLFDNIFVKHTQTSDLISVDSVRSGMLTELVYSVVLKKSSSPQPFLAEVKKLNGNLKVTLITGYNATDL